MKKIFYFLASAIVALGAMACQNEVDENINPNTQSDVVSFTVAFDEATRIAMSIEDKTANFAFETDDVLYVWPTKTHVNSENEPYVFTTEDGETFSCKSAELVEALKNTDNKAFVSNARYLISDSYKGIDGFFFCNAQVEEWDATDISGKVTLNMWNSVLKLTVPENTTATLVYSGDGVASVFTQVDEYGGQGYSESIELTSGDHLVAAAYAEGGTLSYSINGVVIKSIEKDFEAGKIYNLGTLGYEFTTITTKEQLFAFAAHVNAGNSYEGKTVKLGNDIDLGGAAWTPIGNLDVIKYANVNSTFLGTFDGQGYTISNFTIDQTGEAVGFFGAKFAGDIKNVKFDDVTVTGTHYGAVVVGWTDGAQRNADGQWNITGCEVKNSTVTLAPDSTPDNGDKAGAIVGYAYAINVTGNTVSNTTIQAYRDLGAIAGMAQENSKEATTVSGNTVGENVKVVIDNTVNYKNYTTAAQYNAGNYVGRISTNSVVENNNGEATIVLPKTAVEKLAEQIAAGESNITISKSFEMTATDPRINIAEGQNVNITLAEGVEITGTFAESGSDALFNIAKGGELTIGGDGSIALTAVKGNVSNYGQYIFENCGGVLNITGGTYTMEVTGSGSATWFIPTLINNNSTLGETVTNISGGYFYSETCINIMRQFINSKTGNATFNITGGEFKGTGTKTYGIWNQNSGGSGLGYVNISGTAKMNNVYVENDVNAANVVISGGSFGYEPAIANGAYNKVTIAEGYVVTKEGEVWTVAEYVPTAVEKLNEQIAAGGTITLTEDIVAGENEKITVPAGKTVTLDLNGYTISQEKVCTASHELICNNGDLTITGEGTISLKDNSEGDPTFGWGSYTIRNNGNLTIKNGTIEHLSELNGDGVKHMYCAVYSYSGNVVINGGTFKSVDYRSVRAWAGSLTINGGNFEGQVWIQPSQADFDFNINGGTFAPRGGDGSSVFVTNDTHNVDVEITGGTFTTKLGASNAVKGWVKGGQFKVDPSAYVAEGYKAFENEGVWTVNKVYTVYVTAQPKSSAAEWETINLYAWNANGNNSWPGADITANTKEINGYTYRYFTFPASFNNTEVSVIVNNGTQQSPDIVLGTLDKDYYVVYSNTMFEKYETAPEADSIDEYVAPAEPQKLYLNAQNWGYGDARFVAYFFGNGEKWVDMTKVEGKTAIYEVEIPEGFTKVIFARMNGSKPDNNWGNKWNQTGDLIITDDVVGKTFTIKQWDNQTTGWE